MAGNHHSNMAFTIMGVYGAFSMAMICHDFQRLPISYPHGLLKKAHLRVPNRMHLCQNFGEKTGLTLLLILITLLLLLIYVLYIYIHIGHTIYIYGCPTCCFPLVNPLRHPLTHVLRIGMEKPSMDSTICWCRRTPSPSPPSTGTSRSRRRPLPQPRKNRLVDGWISWELYLS